MEVAAAEQLVSSNRAVLALILAMKEMPLRDGVRHSLFPALAAAGWRIDDAIEAIWRGEPVPPGDARGAARDENSAHVVAALSTMAREAALPPPANEDEVEFSFVRNPLGRPGAGAGAGAHSGPGAHGGIDYAFSKRFWTDKPPTVSAMLGGLDQTHEPDVASSLRFLARLGFADDVAAPADARGARARALDCGAGIGRVARHVLLRRFDVVDLLEQDGRFLAHARAELPAKRIGQCICAPLQSAQLALGEADGGGAGYQLVWVQWVLNYLTDDDLVAFLRRAAAALAPAIVGRGALIVVKETHVRHGTAQWVDEEDASLCRSQEQFEALFARAGLEVRAHELEHGMPAAMLPVRMWALAPCASGEVEQRAQAE
ncbi:hypothetical protein KFE25_014395 [Diacronema lutheri]|uniref:Alpha N-terminal protein methyltransferase 1 n=1 Tax=Diacronema lutheri TaxID=2081491 RepID=A0A8J6C2I6_DIALT|nr:hypothetical protein KFE25_014395 [Diacronema lutheri]